MVIPKYKGQDPKKPHRVKFKYFLSKIEIILRFVQIVILT